MLGALVSVAAGLQRIARAKERSDIALVTMIALTGSASAVCTSLGGHYDTLALKGLHCAGEADATLLEQLERVVAETDRTIATELLRPLERAADDCVA